MQHCRILAVSAILLCGALAVQGENAGQGLNRVAAMQTGLATSVEARLATGQTVLIWSPDVAVPFNSKAGVAAGILLPFLLFLAMGYTWQALDEEEFPDAELPRWFVSTFRRRENGFLPRRS